MLIQVQSMTEAVRIRKRLRQKGIVSFVVQTPPPHRRGGCGYSLKISENSLSAVEEAAREMGVRILGVFRSDSV